MAISSLLANLCNWPVAKPRPLHSLGQTVNIRGQALWQTFYRRQLVIFGDKNIIYHLKVTLRALTMHWRVILIILLLRRSMKSFSSRQKCNLQVTRKASAPGKNVIYRSQCKRDIPHIVAIIVWCYSIYMNHSAQHC